MMDDEFRLFWVISIVGGWTAAGAGGGAAAGDPPDDEIDEGVDGVLDVEGDGEEVAALLGSVEAAEVLPHPRFRSPPPRLGGSLDDDEEEEDDEEDRSMIFEEINFNFFFYFRSAMEGGGQGQGGSTPKQRRAERVERETERLRNTGFG